MRTANPIRRGASVLATFAALLMCASARPPAASAQAAALPAPFHTVPPPVDGDVGFSPTGPWVPVQAVDWDAGTATTQAWLRSDWSRRGLHLALLLPHASENVRMDAGRAPDAPFQLVVQLGGGAGEYSVSCSPLPEPVSRMTTRLHAYLFNARLGANARPGEGGHVLCNEVSLLGILASSMETRWTPAPDGGIQVEATIPWSTLRLPTPPSGTELTFGLEVRQPGAPAVHWAGGPIRLLAAGGAASDGAVPPVAVPGPVVRQPAPVVVAYPRPEGSSPAGELTFTLVGQGREHARSRGEPSGDAAFGRLATEGLPDGEYELRVLRGDRVVASRPMRLVGQWAETELDEERARLAARLDRLGGGELTPTLEGHAARARRMLELASLPPHSDSADVARSRQLLIDASSAVDALEAGRRPDAALEGYEHPAGTALDRARGPVTFVPRNGDGARVKVRANRPADWSLTPRLYGTFSEPVVYDRPIYSWLYAQQLRNPSFEFGHPTAEETVEAFIRYQELESEAARSALAGRWLPRVDASVEDEVAAPWIGVGSGDVRFALDCAAYNDRQCQRVMAGSGARNAGVAQVIELPAWRATGYRLTGYFRTDGEVGEARVRLYHDGRVVDSATVAGLDAGWQRRVVNLAAPRLEDQRNAFLLAIVFDGPGALDLDFVTLYPDDAEEGFDPQAVAQLRDLHTGWVRWPGGNYASDYHWADGVGPKELRPSTANPSWPGLNPNLVGTDELLQLADRVGFEVMITVNAGSGTAEEAARWVEYVNGDTTTTLGRLRARNGHPEPYGVRYWNIGNELWGHWQVGYTNPEEYARRYASFAQAMREVDPSIHIIANAHGGHSESPPEPWNRPLLDHYGDELETLDIHTYVGVPDDQGHSPAERAFLLSTIPLSYEQWMTEFREDLVRRGLEHVRVIVGEYNASIGGGPAMDRIGDLLAYGAYLHAFMRQGEYVTGANATDFSPFDPRALPFGRMHPRYDLFRTYAAHAGTRPVEATVETPVVQQPHRVGRDVLPLFNVPVVDAVALRDTTDGSLGISLINRDMERAMPVEIRVEGFRPGSEARWFVFRGEGDGVEEQSVEAGTTPAVTLPPHSVSLLKLYPAPAHGGQR